ncbi:hypothetical protein V8G54_036404 [Vigna mungo]|uniref:Uncharacterized protein n=1 Tax=Vigna mungo TaxID=3915 RepID=A0AAQ3MHB2_VIGMU
MIQVLIRSMYKLCTTPRKPKLILDFGNPVLTPFIFNKTSVRNIAVPNLVAASGPRNRGTVPFRRRNQAIESFPLFGTVPLESFSSLRLEFPNRILVVQTRYKLAHAARAHSKLAHRHSGS